MAPLALAYPLPANDKAMHNPQKILISKEKVANVRKKMYL
jgi:hypothetical protein